jgi:hypothetical protein
MTWKLMLDRDSVGTFHDEGEARAAASRFVAANQDRFDGIYVVGFERGHVAVALEGQDLLSFIDGEAPSLVEDASHFLAV